MPMIPATSDRLSRWTPAIFTIALASFALGQLGIVAGLSWPAVPDAASATFADVHLFTIGWISLLMFGALFQFVPVITGNKLLRQWLSLATLILVAVGLAGMVAGFLLLGMAGAPAWLLPAGGLLVLAGVLTGAVNIGVPLARKHPLPLSAHFVIAALAFLLLTVLLGLCFACALTVPTTAAALAPLVAGGLEYHVLAGVGGWFTLIAIGVSYELLPMFMLAPHDRGVWGRAVLWTAVSGFAIAVVVGLLAPLLPDTAGLVIEQIGRALIAVAIVLYLVDVVRLYRTRRRRQIELHNRAVIGAFVALGIALAVAIAADVTGTLGRAAPTLLVLLILGWFSGLGVTQLYKIVPFLAWLARFGRRLGSGPVPRVQDLVDEPASRKFFVAYFLGVAIAAVAAWFEAGLVVRGAVALSLLATVLLAREYWRAWRGDYVGRRPSVAIPVRPPVLTPKGAAAHEHTRATHA